MDALMLQRAKCRFSRATDTYDEAAQAQQQICLHAARLLSPHLVSYREKNRIFQSALEIGCGTGGFTKYLQRLLPDARWTINDLCEANARLAAQRYATHPVSIQAGDAENVDWQGRYQLIASASVVQWFREPRLWLERMASLQEPGDLLFFTSFLQGTLSEIYELTGKGLSFPPESDWLAWSASSYRPLHVSSETIYLYFNSPVDVLRHLKHTGVTATGGEFWTRNRLASFVEKYQEKFQRTDGKVVLTFIPVYFLLERTNRI